MRLIFIICYFVPTTFFVQFSGMENSHQEFTDHPRTSYEVQLTLFRWWRKFLVVFWPQTNPQDHPRHDWYWPKLLVKITPRKDPKSVSSRFTDDLVGGLIFLTFSEGLKPPTSDIYSIFPGVHFFHFYKFGVTLHRHAGSRHYIICYMTSLFSHG